MNYVKSKQDCFRRLEMDNLPIEYGLPLPLDIRTRHEFFVTSLKLIQSMGATSGGLPAS